MDLSSMQNRRSYFLGVPDPDGSDRRRKHNMTRERIFTFIRMNPGCYFSEIKRALRLNNGSLTYHLKILEKRQLVSHKMYGKFKYFFIQGTRVDDDWKDVITRKQEKVYQLIATRPGLIQREIIEKSHLKRRTVNRIVSKLQREGRVMVKKVGRENHYFINEEGTPVS